jgi:hypothetical protein
MWVLTEKMGRKTCAVASGSGGGETNDEIEIEDARAQRHVQ